MILKALYDYHQRKSSDPQSGIAPLGFEWKEIPFIIVIDKGGSFRYLKDARSESEKLVVRGSSNKTSNIMPEMLWGDSEYVLGVGSKNPKAKNHAFKALVHRLNQTYLNNEEFIAVEKFYQNSSNLETLYNSEEWKTSESLKGVLYSFQLIDKRLIIAEHSDLYTEVDRILDVCDDNESPQCCLVTGNVGKIVRTHSLISLSKEAKSPNGSVYLQKEAKTKLVSFMSDKGYDSYGKQQGGNAPIGMRAEAACANALNYMMRKGSKNKIVINDTTLLFWSDKETGFDDIISSIFITPPKDNPDRNVLDVKSFLESLKTGVYNSDSDSMFYILELRPNVTRISVGGFVVGKLSDVYQNISQHFIDLDIIKEFNDDMHCLSLYNIVKSLSRKGNSKNKEVFDDVPASLIGALTKSVFQGYLYPALLQNLCLNRIRADRKINYARASILKAYINRKNRILNLTKEREITMALDLENKNQGYLLGRLFAVLENIQSLAIKGLNATIKDRYYGAASTTPVTVFGRLLDLSNHHLGKLPVGSRVYFEKLLQDIIDGISSSGMPSHLNLDDQSRFAIGYYHQRKDLFTSNKDNATETNN